MGKLRADTEEEKSEDILSFDDEPEQRKARDLAPSQEGARQPKYENEVRDLQKTGRWGSVSQNEKYVLAAVAALIVIGGIVAVIVLLSGGSSGPAPTLAPTMSPTNRPATTNEQQWSALQDVLRNNGILKSTSELIDMPISDLDGQASNPSASPQVRAASWVILEDERDEFHESKFLQWRFALATLYFALGGADWYNSDGWLGAGDVCDWYGVSCNFPNLDKIVTLDLTKNNLVGAPLPEEITLLDELVSLWLSNNEIGGECPTLAIGSIPTLLYLYINANQFTGEFDANIRTNGILHTLYIQENDFTGNFPLGLCPAPGGAFKLREYGLDCDKLRCFCCSINTAGNDAFDPCF
eukprot:CAMPEP_0194049380 /NCGR_PEP_ID=MMETSP0009_2-20130614/30549_1 /TAXON_ID=210454 /ORGANISM="Grammatophora oceanica, Strain CCMP 410" /LENGTH=353 /DNA_ID=CAMNT_0038695521 /DNA_START=90 /DNA_END=1151 /DNA_ORIENTATION=+